MAEVAAMDWPLNDERKLGPVTHGMQEVVLLIAYLGQLVDLSGVMSR